MATWNLKDTYALVRKAFGSEQEQLARASIRSVFDRLDFARYHFSEAQRLQRAFERKHLSKGLLIDLHAEDSAPRRAAFELFMVKAGAHATAAIQSVHAIPDILAHALYFSTGQALGPGAVHGREIAVTTVAQLLSCDSALGALAAMLRQSRMGHPWHHLDAVANTSKHRSVIRAMLSEDLTGARKSSRELHISAFERDGQVYPAVSFQVLLEPEYNRLSKLVIEVVHALSAHLRAIVS